MDVKMNKTTLQTNGVPAISSIDAKALMQRVAQAIADLDKPVPISELVLDERTLHGSRYYTVEPVGGSWSEMEEWCYETFGAPGEVWEFANFVWPALPRWVQNNRKFWFRNEKDRTWFVMRWTGN